jgi:DNA polymerase III epsilon subunit-like protein
MIKIDKRKNYYLTIDTETANGLDDALVYDIGGAVHDKKGRVYETFSFVIYEVFVGMKNLMQSAYYAEKIPNYEADLRAGTRKMVRYLTAKKHIAELCKKYNVRAIIAHNALFDYRATNTTQRYLTYSKYRYFLPYGLPIYDTLKMARDTIGKQKTYIQWCKNNGYMVNNNRPRLTAEILYRYISGNNSFVEEHTGLEDVLIEKEIFAKCMRQHKKMEKRLFKD